MGAHQSIEHLKCPFAASKARPLAFRGKDLQTHPCAGRCDAGYKGCDEGNYA